MISQLHFQNLENANRELALRFEKLRKARANRDTQVSRMPRWNTFSRCSTSIPQCKMLLRNRICSPFVCLRYGSCGIEIEFYPAHVHICTPALMQFLLTSQTFSVILFRSSWTGVSPQRISRCVLSTP